VSDCSRSMALHNPPANLILSPICAVWHTAGSAQLPILTLHWRLRHFSFEPHRIEENGQSFTDTLSITQGRQQAFDWLPGTNPALFKGD